MPKKQAKNSFYFFMIDFREEQKKKGINYGNMAEVAEAAGPAWKDAKPAVRAKFEEKAKKAKQQGNGLEKKYTSTGIPLSEIDRQEKELGDAEDAERQDIKNIVKLKSFNGAIVHEDFFLIDINWYCKTGSEYLIAESTVLRFNLQDGILDQYHEIINPGKIPMGYTYDVKLGCEEIGLEMPDETQKKSNYFQILANLIDYLQQKDSNVKSMAPLFTLPEKVAPVRDFIFQMCSRAAEDDSIFRVYKLDTLFFMLNNSVKMQKDDCFPRQSLALAELRMDRFKYTPRLGCETHEASDKSTECSTSRTKRWAFTILDRCCQQLGVNLLPGKHVPYDYDVDTILTYKEQKRERAGPSVAGHQLAASINTASSLSETLNECTSSVAENPKKEKRVHCPLRKPKTDYSQTIRPAPELNEANFPSLSSLSHGRGRGLAGSFSKMNLQK